MSREKFNWVWMAKACPPEIMAVPAVGLLLAAKMASSMAPINSGDCWLWRDIKRAMWRWVTWVSSCANTEANSWRLATVAISPKCTPK